MQKIQCPYCGRWLEEKVDGWYDDEGRECTSRDWYCSCGWSRTVTVKLGKMTTAEQLSLPWDVPSKPCMSYLDDV